MSIRLLLCSDLDCTLLPNGGLLGMNGNFSAGVLKAIVHFIPRQRHGWSSY
jgi:hypothetical protein